ncbi:unnamed protein product [Linum trigynum]|uniref:Uncharacterized protein n=1 Tax=Linum trigynum TaxID=586398 RepID=A0AAV2F347_9ROSI
MAKEQSQQRQSMHKGHVEAVLKDDVDGTNNKRQTQSGTKEKADEEEMAKENDINKKGESQIQENTQMMDNLVFNPGLSSPTVKKQKQWKRQEKGDFKIKNTTQNPMTPQKRAIDQQHQLKAETPKKKLRNASPGKRLVGGVADLA